MWMWRVQSKGVTGPLKTLENWKLWCFLQSTVPGPNLQRFVSKLHSLQLEPACRPHLKAPRTTPRLEGLTGAEIRHPGSVGP